VSIPVVECLAAPQLQTRAYAHFSGDGLAGICDIVHLPHGAPLVGWRRYACLGIVQLLAGPYLLLVTECRSPRDDATTNAPMQQMMHHATVRNDATTYPARDGRELVASCAGALWPPRRRSSA
jgi:hypothetical protein